MKIKEWPIVLICSLQYWCRTGEWLAILSFYSLDQFKGPETDDTQCETINTGSDERSVLSSMAGAKALLSDVQGRCPGAG
jgi:hypothetical protein